MAPQTEITSTARTVELRHLNGCNLEPLLREEADEWDRKLDWDFSKSAELVRRLADAGELGGVALIDRGEVAGYAYCGLADGKGQIWDVYVRPRWRKANAEEVLFRLLFDALKEAPGVRRIESQLMLVANTLKAEPDMRVFERILMKLATLLSAAARPGRPLPRDSGWSPGTIDTRTLRPPFSRSPTPAIRMPR